MGKRSIVVAITVLVARIASAERASGGVVVGAALGGGMTETLGEASDGPNIEAWIGGRPGAAIAVMGHLAIRDGYAFSKSIGASARLWPMVHDSLGRRIYADATARVIAEAQTDDDVGGQGTVSNTGVLVGGALGVEVLSTNRFTIDARGVFDASVFPNREPLPFQRGTGSTALFA